MFLPAFDAADSDVATLRVVNDISATVKVQHCAESCGDLTDTAEIAPGGHTDANISTDRGSEYFVVTRSPQGTYLCVHATYNGSGDGRPTALVSGGRLVSASRDCG
jgi:hypothetical protein